jgi:alcohol dehydrogenase class IV
MSQKEYIGCGKLSALKQIIKEKSVKKILLVTGNYSYHQSEAKDKIQSYLHSVEISRFCEFSVNPKIDEAKKGIALIRSFEPDLILAIGGGSVIDMAKLINTLAVNCDNDNDNVRFVRDGKKNINKGKTLIAVPTTAGTGSEATHFAVAYINGKKYSIAHQCLLPDYVIIDPTLTYHMPKTVAASSGIDALSQAIESYWAINSTTKSKAYAEKSIKIILPNIIKAVCNKDIQSMNAMALGSNLSGKAINISKTTAAHAMSYSISALINISHWH